MINSDGSDESTPFSSSDNHDDIQLGKRILRKKREAIGIDVKHKQMMAQQKRNKNRSTDKSTTDQLWQPKYGWNAATLRGGAAAATRCTSGSSS